MKKSKRLNTDAVKAKIDRFYDINKVKIDTALRELFPGDRDLKPIFRESVLRTRLAYNMSTESALKNVIGSETYKTEGERLKENMFKGLKFDKGAYAEWRRLTGHKKIDFDRIVYEGDNRYSYIQGNTKIYVDYSNSPQRVYVWGEKLV